MRHFTFLSRVCGILVIALPLLAVAEPAIVEDLGGIPSGWAILGPANTSHLIRLSIALETQGHEVLEKTLYEISDPDHARYGQHLSRDEAAAIVHPRQDAEQSVRNWLSSADIVANVIQHRGSVIDVTVPVGSAESLLHTKYHVFKHSDNREAMGSLAYSVPADLRPHIAAVQPTTFFEIGGFFRQSRRAEPGQGSGDTPSPSSRQPECENNNTPACLASLYDMRINHSAKPDHRSLLGVAGFDKQAAQHDQLDLYLGRFARYAAGAGFTTDLINHGTNPQGKEYSSQEANMDIQIAVAMAHNIPVRYYAVGGEEHDFVPDLDLFDRQKTYVEPWLQFASYMLQLPDESLPQVISVSYGVNEQLMSRRYAEKVCQLFGQLTLRGVSIIAASGDSGPGYSCQSNDGSNTIKFLPVFPATCPYVTAVGATQGRGPERALNFSSGGFSDYWPRPAWQQAAVAEYLSLHGSRWRGYYNPSGRAFPDVSAQGIDYPIFDHDGIKMGGGTSASAPLFAAMIAVINDDRLRHDRPPLGFLNPWLYSSASSAFTDITRGRSEGCQGRSVSGTPAPLIPGTGWDAVEGWDPVTGLGTPQFERLRKLAMSLDLKGQRD